MPDASHALVRDIKEARPDHPVLSVIAQRWSPRSFADRPVEPEKLRQVLEAARWAPSSFNEQPWRFLIATKDDPEAYAQMLSVLNEKNQQWARQAPVLILSVAKTTFSRNDKPNRHAWHDVGLAMGNLLAQATALDLFVHQMAGLDPEKAREVYAIPEDFEVVAGAAIGYLGAPDDLPESFQKSETKARSRRALTQTVFEGTWGETAPLVDDEDHA
ncbi:MAG: nitroreductase [Bacteroidetes bacterium]|nr:nitroreductase [Bacteroidota bacterium]